MRWSELKSRLHEDPAHHEAMERQFPYREVALAVARLRADNDLTQAELAERANTTQSVIARLESGKHPVSAELLTRIARAVGKRWRPLFEPQAETPAELFEIPSRDTVAAKPATFAWGSVRLEREFHIVPVSNTVTIYGRSDPQGDLSLVLRSYPLFGMEHLGRIGEWREIANASLPESEESAGSYALAS